MHPHRRGFRASAPSLAWALLSLALAACGATPGASQVSRDAQLVVTAVAPLARGAAGLGLAPAAVADADTAFTVASAEARNLASQGIPTRIDVQEFLLATRTLERTLAPAPGLRPDAVRIIDAVTALLPAMADAVGVPFVGGAPKMSPDQARLVLRDAAPAAATASPPPVPLSPAPLATAPSVAGIPPPVAPAVAPPSKASPPSTTLATPADAGLVTLRSRHGFAETLARFEAAIRANGWKVFAVIDHAAAAREAGQALPPRTVVLFGNPSIGTAALRPNPTLALDLPMRALVWEDDAGAVWLTANAADYVGARIYGRHGYAAGQDALSGYARFLESTTRAATQ